MRLLGDRVPSAQTLWDLRVELLSLMVRLARRLEAACEADAEPKKEEKGKRLEACAVDGKTVRASGNAERGQEPKQTPLVYSVGAATLWLDRPG